MNLIREIKDEDFGLNPANSAPIIKRREAVRAILLDDNNRVGLVHAKTGGYYMLPGGGLEKNETHEDCLCREVIEEAGYEVKVGDSVGYIDEYRCQDPLYPNSGLKQTSYCYVANARKQASSNLMEYEKGDGFVFEWIDDVKLAIDLLKNSQFYETKWTSKYAMAFFEERDRTFLETYLSSKTSK